MHNCVDNFKILGPTHGVIIIHEDLKVGFERWHGIPDRLLSFFIAPTTLLLS